MQTSHIILKHLIDDDNFLRRVLPFIQESYFESRADKVIFSHVRDFVSKYSAPPTIEALYIELTNDSGIPEDVYKDIDTTLKDIREPMKRPELAWLMDTTEKFCKDRALFLALSEAISIYDGNNKKLDKGAIPELLTQALAVGFDTTVGHDYFENAAERLEYYHRHEEKISTGFAYFDNITKGGFGRKTLNIFLAGTHGGKSALMVNMAANNLMDGKNVLFVSLEMREEEISKRIDARLMGINMDEFSVTIPKKMFEDKIGKLKAKTHGRLVVKEYPTSSAHTGHIRTLLNELLLKKKFVPDIIYVDYLNIMTSFRIKPGTSSNTNTYYKSISEELRGLGVEMNVPIVSASQFNRGGFASSDPNMDDISESFGVNFTGDFIVALMASEDLVKLNQVLVKQLKSRYDDKNRVPMFMIGFDRMKMTFFDLQDPFSGMNKGGSSPVQPVPTSNTNGFSSPPKKGFSGFKHK